MLPQFSVRQPYTVLVAVVLVLVLGVISFTGMTTDLLPPHGPGRCGARRRNSEKTCKKWRKAVI